MRKETFALQRRVFASERVGLFSESYKLKTPRLIVGGGQS